MVLHTKEAIVAQKHLATERFIRSTHPAFYLPLWKKDHGESGGKLLSSDGFGHICTVTGALRRFKGYFFDGVNDKILSSTNSIFEFTTAFTIEVWVNVDVSVPAQHQFAVELGDTAGIERMGICARRNAAGNLLGCYNAAIPDWVMANSACTPGIWEHIVGVFNPGAGNLDFFLNTVADGSPALGGFQAWTGGTTLVNISPATGYLKGLIGEVRVYNRGLSPPEIQRNYTATRWRFR